MCTRWVARGPPWFSSAYGRSRGEDLLQERELMPAAAQWFGPCSVCVVLPKLPTRTNPIASASSMVLASSVHSQDSNSVIAVFYEAAYFAVLHPVPLNQPHPLSFIILGQEAKQRS